MNDFKGCKLLVQCADHLLTFKRDANHAIPYPSQWDLPGGGREGNESPEECALRELKEEFGLTISPSRIHYKQRVPSHTGIGYAYFLAIYINDDEVASIQFGDEGQYWKMMPISEYLILPTGIPSNKTRLKLYLSQI